MSLQPGTTLGNYEIVEKIGAGGMGSVYKAYQTSLGRYVAIKILPPQTAGDPAFGERFAQEARAIGKLRHPNIVTAFDFTQQGDIAYLVSDYIDGGTLADQLGAALPLDYALGILGPIAAALDYAHARGIVHRDIKPQNVLLTREGTPVLTDFGLAKIVGPGSGMTQAGSLMGTADYMAPELAGGAESAGPAADQYALGIIAYQMLVGRHPFPSDNPLSALMAHVNKPVPLPSQLGAVLPPGAEAALLRVLAKKPEDRFARSGDFVRALAGSQYSVPGGVPTGFVAPSTSPSQPPVVAAPLAAAAPAEASFSPLLSPAGLVGPVARIEPPSKPPTAEPTIAAAPVAGGTPVVAGGGVAAAAVIATPTSRAGLPWRRALVPGILILVLAILALRGGTDRGANAGRTNAPQGTARQTAALTVAPTTAPTIAPTIAPTTAPTVAPTVQPTVRPTSSATVTDDQGNTPATASAITPGAHAAAITPAGDVDFFRVIVPANTLIAFELRVDSLAAAGITVFAMGGEEVVDEQNTGPDKIARVTYVARAGGAFFARVRGARPELNGTYTISYASTAR